MVLLGVPIMSYVDLCHGTNSLVIPGKVHFAKIILEIITQST